MNDKVVKTHCIHNHELTPDNIYITKKGLVECRICRTVSREKYRKSHHNSNYKLTPWKGCLITAKHRCQNKKSKAYRYYGGKGVKCLMTEQDFQYLWFRDKAYNMKRPSIDRRDPNGNYEIFNCRFIELAKNISRAHAGKKHFKQGGVL